MTAACSHRRSGITLTEILIAILIMGVGLISLATLFPLGLIRLREATRQSRAGLTLETAADDSNIRAFLYKPSFHNTWYGLRDPFTQDALPNGTYNATNTAGNGVLASGSLLLPNNNVGLTTGLPFCYDPLWRSLTGVVPNTGLYDPTLDFKATYATAADEARFGSGIFASTTPYIHADPGGGVASAHGLQRLSNFIPWSPNLLTPQYNFTHTNIHTFPNITPPPDVAGNVFTSNDDLVFNPTEGGANAPSSLLPDMSSGGPQADYRFTWFFTGRQVDANGNGAQFTGEIVVFDGRPFGFDPVPGLNASAPAGETVVEAIYGYGGNPKAVLLRWRDTLADPPLRVGSWIADTTYERHVPIYKTRVGNTLTSFARCYWYQIAKRVDPTYDAVLGNNYRSTVVTLTSPVRTVTSTANNLGITPIHLNVALIMPSVINVFPRSFEVH